MGIPNPWQLRSSSKMSVLHFKIYYRTYLIYVTNTITDASSFPIYQMNETLSFLDSPDKKESNRASHNVSVHVHISSGTVQE